MKYYYNYKLLKLLDMNNIQYNRSEIFDKLIETNLMKEICLIKRKLYFMNFHLLNMIIEHHLYGTNYSFYNLFYLQSGKWRYGLKNGFTKKYVYKIIESFCYHKEFKTFNYNDKGKTVKELCI